MLQRPSHVSIAIVYYEKDVDLAALLGRTIEAFVPAELVDRIYLLNNYADETAGQAAFDTQIAPVFTRFSEHLQYVAARDLGVAPEKDSYSAQQALKLEIARNVETPYYLVLDSKNHFTRPVSWEDFFASDGRAKTHTARHGGYLQTCFQHSLAYFGLKLDPEDTQVLPTITPYMMHRDTVRDMLAAIYTQDRLSVAELIRANNKRTEFLLYCAYLKKIDQIEAHYAFAPRPFVTLFTRSPEEEDAIDRHLAQLEQPLVYAFGLHAKRFAQLSEKHIGMISDFWARRGIFNSPEAGRAFIKDRAKAVPLPPAQPKLNPQSDGKVRIGRKGRLFLHNDTNKVLDQQLGKHLLSEGNIALWQEVLDHRKAAAQKIGAQYQLLVAPDTASVYPEDHPDLDGYDGPRPVLQLQQALRPDTPWLYPLDALQKARRKGEVCHPTDSHWTGFGAYIAYRALRKKVRGLTPLWPMSVERIEKEGAGDLGDKFLPPLTGAYTECVLRKPPSIQIWNNGINNRGYMGYWRHQNPRLPRAILFMDSYGWKFSRFLAASFSEMLMVHTPYFEQEAVDKYQPDVIINLMAERFLIHVPDERTGPPALDTARQKDPQAHYPDLHTLGR